MWNFIFKKTILSFIFLIITLFIVFLLISEFNGDPFKDMLDSATDPVAAQKEHAAKLALMGLNHPPLVRLGIWIKNFFHGDLGKIYVLIVDEKTVSGAIFKPLSYSMRVVIPAYILGTVFGLGLGILSGYKRGKATDVFINWFVSIFISIPSFVLAAFAILIGPAVNLPTSFEDAVGGKYQLMTLILPILVVTLVSLAQWTYRLRAEIASILSSDYILAARTKGYSEWFIFKRYVLRNSMYPFAGALATGFTIALSSSLIAERFFNVPGTATLMINAVKVGETNIVIGNALIMGAIGLVVSIFGEAAQISINPVVRSIFAVTNSPLKKLEAFFIRKKVSRDFVKQMKLQGGLDD